MSKELFIAAHEEQIGEYLELHPNADESEAYDKTADKARERMIEKLANAADEARDRLRYEHD